MCLWVGWAQLGSSPLGLLCSDGGWGCRLQWTGHSRWISHMAGSWDWVSGGSLCMSRVSHSTVAGFREQVSQEHPKRKEAEAARPVKGWAHFTSAVFYWSLQLQAHPGSRRASRWGEGCCSYLWKEKNFCHGIFLKFLPPKDLQTSVVTCWGK